MALDSVSELQILSETNARYRREILGLKQFFAGRNCSVFFLDDRTTREGEHTFKALLTASFVLERLIRDFGDSRPQDQIIKLRGVPSAMVCTT